MADLNLGWFEVSLDVKDIKRSLAFYQTLGFQIVDGSIEKRNVTLQKADCRIALYQGHLDPPVTQLIFWQGDVEAIADELTRKGLHLKKSADESEAGGVGAMLMDPDGHPLYFVNMPGVTRKDSGTVTA